MENHKHTGQDMPQINPSDFEDLPGTTTVYLRGDGTWGTNTLTTVASDDLAKIAATEKYQDTLTYVKMKEIQVNMPGTIRVKFDLARNYNTLLAYASLRKNEVEIREFTSNTSYNVGFESKTESSITVSAGDKISLYGKATSGYADQTVWVRNFGIYYTVIIPPVVIVD